MTPPSPAQADPAAGAGATATPWDAHARQWHRLKSPLRPCEEDVRPVQREVDRLAQTRPGLRVLLLGVTAELAALRFPPQGRLYAVDSAFGMLTRQWRPPTTCAALPVQGAWERLPLPDASMDLVLADGSLCVLSHPGPMREVLASAARVLRPQAAMVVRLFLRPDRPERLDEVLAAMQARKIGSLHAAKWRVAMALHGSLTDGVVLDDVWNAFVRAAPDFETLAERTGWPLESIETLHAYRGVQARYVFPTLAEARALLAAHFDEHALHVPGYELGERCPTFVLSRRA